MQGAALRHLGRDWVAAQTCERVTHEINVSDAFLSSGYAGVHAKTITRLHDPSLPHFYATAAALPCPAHPRAPPALCAPSAPHVLFVISLFFQVLISRSPSSWTNTWPCARVHSMRPWPFCGLPGGRHMRMRVYACNCVVHAHDVLVSIAKTLM